MEKLVRGKGIYDSCSRRMNGTGLVIRKDQIIDVGIFEELLLKYPEAERLNYADEYIMPGMINTHVHLEFTPSEDTYGIYGRESIDEHLSAAVKAAEQLLLSGVTTVRDAGSSMELVNLLNKGGKGKKGEKTILPRIQTAGMPITVSAGHLSFLGKATDRTEDLIQGVYDRIDAGCTCIKIIASGGQLTPGSKPEVETYDEEQICAVTEAAHKKGVPVLAHCLTTKSFVNAMRGNVDSIEHCACFVRNQEFDLLERQFISESMNTFKGDNRFFMIGFSNNYHKLDEVRMGKRKGGERELFLLEQEDKEGEIFRELVKSGLRPTVGTDGGCGLTYFEETWLELELLVERCGLSVQEAIHAVTVSGAQALGYGNWLGMLKPGYQGDFITMEVNPLENIKAFRKINHVISNGELIK